MYLVDTNVISAGASPKSHAHQLVAWMAAHSDALFLSVVTAAEIEAGIAKARRAGAKRKAGDLETWFEALLHLYGDRVLPFDLAAARIADDLSDRASAQGHAPGLADIIIAATAAHHGLTILTRNLRHFTPLGVMALDPFIALPRE